MPFGCPPPISPLTTTSARVRSGGGRAGFAGAYALPIRIAGHTVGGLDLLTEEPRTLADGDLRTLQALADVAVRSLIRWNASPLRPDEVVTHTQAALSAKAALDPLIHRTPAPATVLWGTRPEAVAPTSAS